MGALVGAVADSAKGAAAGDDEARGAITGTVATGAVVDEGAEVMGALVAVADGEKDAAAGDEGARGAINTGAVATGAVADVGAE
jgi:hypothetical protein